MFWSLKLYAGISISASKLILNIMFYLGPIPLRGSLLRVHPLCKRDILYDPFRAWTLRGTRFSNCTGWTMSRDNFFGLFVVLSANASFILSAKSRLIQLLNGENRLNHFLKLIRKLCSKFWIEQANSRKAGRLLRFLWFYLSLFGTANFLNVKFLQKVSTEFTRFSSYTYNGAGAMPL